MGMSQRVSIIYRAKRHLSNSDKVMIKDININKMLAINVEMLIYNIRYIYGREW